MQASLPVGKHVIVLLRTPPPHCGHRKHLRTPQCRLPGVQDGPARLRRTPVTHCGHRHSALRTPGLPWIADTRIPQYGQPERLQIPPVCIADTAGTYTLGTADLPAGTRHGLIADNTCNTLRSPQLRIADTAGTCTLHNADSTCHSDRVWPAPVADSTPLHCKHRRYPPTPQCGTERH